MERKIIIIVMFVMTAMVARASAEEAVKDADPAQKTAVADTVRSDTSVQAAAVVDTAQSDTVAQETAIVDTAQLDTARSAAIVDTVRSDTIARETAAVDTARSDTAAQAAAVVDTVLSDTARTAAIVDSLPAEPALDTAEPTESAPAISRARDVDPRTMRGVYLFSLRPEFHVVFDEINSLGFVGEVGMVDLNGLFISLDISGGMHYLGAGLNFGHSFASDGNVKNAIGYSFGYYNTDIVTKFESESGKQLKRYVGNNVGVTGLFWKIKWGKTGHVDVTNRVMFGYKNDSVRYDKDDGAYKERGFTASYSVSAGYTLVRRK